MTKSTLNGCDNVHVTAHVDTATMSLNVRSVATGDALMRGVSGVSSVLELFTTMWASSYVSHCSSTPVPAAIQAYSMSEGAIRQCAHPDSKRRR